jgi:hypothetical protein
MSRPNFGNVQLGAEAFREGGVWRVRLTGPLWLFTDLELEIAETGQQLDIVGMASEVGKDQMFGHDLASVDLAIAPRRPRRKRPSRQSGNDGEPVVVDMEAFLRP